MPQSDWTGLDVFYFAIANGIHARGHDFMCKVTIRVLNSLQFGKQHQFPEVRVKKNTELRGRLPWREPLAKLCRAQELSKLASDLEGTINIAIVEALNAPQLTRRE